jgi:hypothetical protein
MPSATIQSLLEEARRRRSVDLEEFRPTLRGIGTTGQRSARFRAGGPSSCARCERLKKARRGLVLGQHSVGLDLEGDPRDARRHSRGRVRTGRCKRIMKMNADSGLRGNASRVGDSRQLTPKGVRKNRPARGCEDIYSETLRDRLGNHSADRRGPREILVPEETRPYTYGGADAHRSRWSTRRSLWRAAVDHRRALDPRDFEVFRNRTRTPTHLHGAATST